MFDDFDLHESCEEHYEKIDWYCFNSFINNEKYFYEINDSTETPDPLV